MAKVRKGQSAEITIRGEVVARMTPVSEAARKSEAERRKTWEEFMERLRTQPPLGVPRGVRDELYDDD